MDLLTIGFMYVWDGSGDASASVDLDPSSTFLAQTYLTTTDGGDYAQAFISEVCIEEGDQINCGVKPPGVDASATQVLTSATSVTFTLHTTGGQHRAEFAVYKL